MARKRAQLTDEGTLATLDAGGILARIGSEATTLEIREVPLGQLRPNPFQPRQHFAQESLEELAASMRAHGFYGHLLVRQHGRNYQVAYGERRLRAAKLAGLTAIPVRISDLSDKQMLEIALTENVVRENLHPVEEAHAYAQLHEKLGIGVREIAERIGKSKSYVGTLLSLLRYPDVEEAVRTADIPVRTAEELAKIEDAAQRQRYLALVIAGQLDRDQLIALRQQGQTPGTVRSADRNRSVTDAIRRAQRTLERQRGAQVPTEEKVQTIELLHQIIEQARQLLAELEEK